MRYLHPLLRATLLVPAAWVLVATLPAQAADLDARIEKTVRASYTFKVILKDDRIAVASSNGVVTLTGTVAEDYHRYLAGETVTDTAGVASVKNELTVASDQPSENSDAWLTLKVKGALAFHKKVSASGTEVFTNAGVVTLKGEAGSAAQRELTGEYAKDVQGVKRVDNQMTVAGIKPRETVVEGIDDASITAQIKTSLLFHQSTHVLTTQVKTRKGVVVLQGITRDAAEKALVGKLAEDITGVKRVDNRMVVKPS